MAKVRDFLRRHPEFFRYCLVGVSTTVLTLLIYFLLVATLLDAENPLELQIANLVSWVCGTLFSYSANRHFVFRSRNPHILREAASFFASRLFALVLDMGMMALLVSVLEWSDTGSKILSIAAQTVTNYVLSKFIVFHKCRRD